MEWKQKRELLVNRYKAIDDEERKYMSNFATYTDTKFRYEMERVDYEELGEGHSEWYWETCILGSKYVVIKPQAQYWAKNPKKFVGLLKKVQGRKRWGTLRGYRHFLELAENGDLTTFGVMCFLYGLGKDDDAVWKCYANKPKFGMGEMVKFRSNAGVDSVLQKHTYNSHSTYYGCGGRKLEEAKKKTYMIIEVDPELDGGCYAKTYSYHEKQGGCRYYKVLPMGEAKTYFVVEKFLKKFRVPKCK